MKNACLRKKGREVREHDAEVRASRAPPVSTTNLLDLGESAVWVLKQRQYRCGDNRVHVRVLDGVIGSVICGTSEKRAFAQL